MLKDYDDKDLSEKDLVEIVFNSLSAPKVETKKSYTKDGIEITHQMICDAIKLFEPHFPQEFTESRPPYSVKPVLTAMSKILETTSFVNLNTMIQQYFVIKRDEAFRPLTGTILEFCTTKFVKIQDFLRPKSGGARYSLANIPGEKKGEFNEKHKNKLDKLTQDRERVNREFKEKMEVD